MKTALRSTASLLALSLSSGAYAQSSATDAQSGDAAAAESTGPQLLEVIVTAQRIEENRQTVAVPVAVISPDDLRRAGVASAEMLTALVPSLSVANTGAAGMIFFLRGVGNFSLSSYVDSAIAFNYDDVYIGRPTGTAGLFYDLQRIEVLKGPQDTLYGRNATGGAINVLPAHPKLGAFEGYVNTSYGNYRAVTLESAINLPLQENAALRISGNLNDHDGYLSDGTSDSKMRALRVQWAAELTPDLTVRVAGDFASLRGAGLGSLICIDILPPQQADSWSPPAALPIPSGCTIRLPRHSGPAPLCFRQRGLWMRIRPSNTYAMTITAPTRKSRLPRERVCSQ